MWVCVFIYEENSSPSYGLMTKMLNLTQGMNTNTSAVGDKKANIMANIMGPWGCTGNSHEASLDGLNGGLTDRSGSGSQMSKRSSPMSSQDI